MESTKNWMREYGLGNQTLMLGELADRVRERINVFEKTDPVTRIFRKDPTVFIPDRTLAMKAGELTDRLGWLSIPREMLGRVSSLVEFAGEIKGSGCKNVVLLGMGGSSLAPEVFARTFGSKEGYPSLRVLDSTHPDQIQAVKKSVKLDETFFLVSSKSGTTLETMSLYRYFYGELEKTSKNPGLSFAAITDPGTPLEIEAGKKGFRKVFSAPKDVGGRYSALTYFGLVPAALIGVDVETLLKNAQDFARKVQSTHPLAQNPSVLLGAALGEFALSGRNKLTFELGEGLEPFGDWIEQLIAESTGKHSKGILPVIGERLGPREAYRRDRVFVSITMKRDGALGIGNKLRDLNNAGHPVIEIEVGDKTDLGAEFYRWEMATAVAGAILNINPFDQPDVELAKKKAKEAMKAFEEANELAKDKPFFSMGGIETYSPKPVEGNDLNSILDNFFSLGEKGDYVSIMAYLPRTKENEKALDKVKERLFESYKLATTVGFGPRFLHSTGQLHKGGFNGGLFLQITSKPDHDLPVPQEKYSFGTVIAAQAMGDYSALIERERRVLRVHLCNGDKDLKKL